MSSSFLPFTLLAEQDRYQKRKIEFEATLQLHVVTAKLNTLEAKMHALEQKMDLILKRFDSFIVVPPPPACATNVPLTRAATPAATTHVLTDMGELQIIDDYRPPPLPPHP